jgi:Bacterioferritin-associated ferredoxin
MYVCLCTGMTESQIRAAAREGACSIRELRQRLGVCAACGKCAPHVSALLKEEQTCVEPSKMLEPVLQAV